MTGFMKTLFNRLARSVSRFLFGTPEQAATATLSSLSTPSGVVRVNSTVINQVHHDPDNCLLTVEFHNGRVYHYFDVPATVATELVESQSCGRYFNQYVRDSYDYEEVPGTLEEAAA